MRPAVFLVTGLTVALPLTACAREDTPPPRVGYAASPDGAFHLRLSDLTETQQPLFLGRLASVTGVRALTLEDRTRVRPEAEEGVTPSETELAQAAAAAGARLDQLLLPEHARVTVHTMLASGGG